ncbi:stabilin-2-like, partial [Limulus polyphemus]|uniref:Stabilin-2-like n=1 Tax=Limulus polyphemus TaxID=6850 RepID=A0ABM1C0L4_LIMPO
SKLTSHSTVEGPCRQGSSQCGPNSKCVEEGDNFRCVCEQGYEYLYEDDVNGEKATCLDINECTSGRDNCHLYAECVNLPGSFACRCLLGYSGNGVNCERTLTCNDLNCDANAECDLGPNGIPVCRCKAGFEGDGYVCQHVGGIGEDCRIVNYCDSHASCNFNPTAQKFQCQCNPGYTGDGVVCIEEESPSTCDVANNCDENALCVYQYGEYVCECNSGFSGDGYKCVPETPVPVSCNIENICHPQALCVFDSSADEYKCRCNAGFVGDGYQCTQSHECNTVENCDRNAQCTYDSSSNRYQCKCNPGYSGDGKSCQLEEATPKFEGESLLFAQGMSLLQMPFNPTRNNPGKLVLMEPYQTAIGVTTDCQKGHVYWTDVAHRVIRRANYDGSNSEVFIKK